MPVSASVCRSACHKGLTPTTELKRNLPLPSIVERALLLSPKGSSDKQWVKAPESLSPEGRDFYFFVHFLFCFFSPSLLFSFLHSFSSVSLSSWLRENPILPGACDGRKPQKRDCGSVELEGVHWLLYVNERVPS